MDRYDFNKGMSDIETGTPDEVNGGFAVRWRPLVGARPGAALKGALVVAAIVSVGSCGSPEPQESAPGTDSASEGCEVRDTTQQVADRFSKLGEVISTQWCAMDLTGGSSRAPGPSDIRMVGYFETSATDIKAILDGPERKFEQAEPEDIPEPLRGAINGKTEWVTSPEVDEEITGGLYTGTFSFDRDSHRVLFDTVNPARAEDEGAVAGG
ncbi:hypothetical protein ACWD26_14410 [Streptomyces sp. NPDC002787]